VDVVPELVSLVFFNYLRTTLKTKEDPMSDFSFLPGSLLSCAKTAERDRVGFFSVTRIACRLQITIGLNL